jgi:hypothetical protein
VGFGVLQRADRRAIERELTELYEKMASEAADNTENEMDESLSSNTTSTCAPRDSKGSRMIDFLDSMDRKKVASLPTRRSNSRNCFGEELSTYRSLAQKRYNEIVEGVDDGDAVSSKQSEVIRSFNRSSLCRLDEFLATASRSVEDIVYHGCTFSLYTG